MFNRKHGKRSSGDENGKDYVVSRKYNNLLSKSTPQIQIQKVISNNIIRRTISLRDSVRANKNTRTTDIPLIKERVRRRSLPPCEISLDNNIALDADKPSSRRPSLASTSIGAETSSETFFSAQSLESIIRANEVVEGEMAHHFAESGVQHENDAAFHLYIGCLSDAPVEFVRGIISAYPDVVNDRTADPLGRSPLELVLERARSCTCGCCNYNRNKVISVLQRGGEYYKSKKKHGLRSVSSCIAEKDDSDDSYSTFSKPKHKSVNFAAKLDHSILQETQTNKNNVPKLELSEENLKRRDQLGKQILYQREIRWRRYIHEFRKLKNEIHGLQQEILITRQDLNKTLKTISKLKKSLQKEETGPKPKPKRFQIFSSYHRDCNDNTVSLNVDIGIATLDKMRLEPYLLEIEEQERKANKAYRSMEFIVFDSIDRQLKEIYGSSSSRNCAMEKDIFSL